MNSGTSPHTYSNNIMLGDVKQQVLISPNSLSDPSKTMLASNSNTHEIQLSSMRKFDEEFRQRQLETTNPYSDQAAHNLLANVHGSSEQQPAHGT